MRFPRRRRNMTTALRNIRSGARRPSRSLLTPARSSTTARAAGIQPCPPHAGRTQLAGGEKELEAGQKEYDEGLAAFTQAKQDALDQLDAAQAQIDAAQKQLDDSGILVQYEALQITRRQLTERLASQEPGSAEALLTRD